MDDDEQAILRFPIAEGNLFVDSEIIASLCARALSYLGLDGLEAAVRFVSLEEMSGLNGEYRGRDGPTDVLSFPQLDLADTPLQGTRAARNREQVLALRHGDEDITLGDIVICPELALTNAKKIGHTLDREVCFLLVHGLLHICGHDHQSPAQEALMKQVQQELMQHLDKRWEHCARAEG